MGWVVGGGSVRVPPEIQAAVAVAAEVSGQSINQWAAERLAQAIRP